jgi:hypothetical protein
MGVMCAVNVGKPGLLEGYSGGSSPRKFYAEGVARETAHIEEG